MKNNVKVILGTIAGFILGGATIVCANQAIQAIQNTEIKISLNGQVQEFADEATGEKQYPITYNNRTYLPLRNVAELSGLDVDYDASTKTAILKSNNKNVYSNADLLVQEKIRYKIANELDEKNPNFYNNNYFDLIARADLNNDGQMEYVIIVVPFGDTFNLRVFSSTGEELKDGLEQLEQLVDCFEIRKGDNGDYIILIQTSFGDGLCYDSNTIYEVKLVDGKFDSKIVGRYVCDEEEEERKRAEIVHDDGSYATDEEAAAAHTLKYLVYDKVVTEEEYKKAIDDYKANHELVNKIK